jgi:para-nitrobenzyl esterase
MASSFLFLTLALAVCAVCQFELVRGQSGPQVSVESGIVEGSWDSTKHVNSFLGIPYAAAPVGDLRLSYPELPVSWQGVRQATSYGSMCVQTVSGEVAGSEDCLFINVNVHDSTFATRAGSPLVPVMVFIHGGSFTSGDGYHDGTYDGSNWASNHPELIVVTFNYRLGALGFLALPELAGNSTQNRTGNYGLADQVAALQWIQRNIAAFGGDKNRVTVFGESAGGFSVSTHLVSPLSVGLFQSAIIESGAGIVASYWQPLTNTIANSQNWVEQIGCPSSGPTVVSCLRQQQPGTFMSVAAPIINVVSITEITHAQWSSRFRFDSK